MDFVKRFNLTPHVEGGAFRELYRDGERAKERPAHGVIYYELGQGEASQFHTLDADEYWFFHAGSTLELWEIDNAKLTKYKLGLEDGAEPCVLMKAGTIFGAKHLSPADEATLVSCVTVPEFTYDHYRICELEEVVNLCPAAGEFYTK